MFSLCNVLILRFIFYKTIGNCGKTNKTVVETLTLFVLCLKCVLHRVNNYICQSSVKEINLNSHGAWLYFPVYEGKQSVKYVP